MSGFFSKDFINRIRESVDIVSLINMYLPLERAGNRYKARCPFHTEKTPSFTVTPEIGRYYCFGCHETGDAINFIMKMNNLDFPEAVEYLANMQGISIEYEKGDVNYSSANTTTFEEKKAIYECMKTTANYYYKALINDKEAYSYLSDRGLSKETIKKFGLGYANGQFTDLYDFLKDKFSDRIMLGGAVIREKNDNKYDYFINRIMFPIQEVSGKVVAFGGRVFLGDENGPKYLNSPETSIFKKNAVLYNLNNARTYVKSSPLVLVEGYMDVISLYDKGYKCAVATLGTAFTENHAKIIGRYTPNVVILYDSDQAGERATEKAIDILMENNIYPKIARLPSGEDPDSFILKNGLESFNSYIQKATDCIEYKLKTEQKSYDLNQNWDRVNYTKKACKILGAVKDEIRREFYIKKLSEQMDTSIESIIKEIQTNSYLSTNEVKNNTNKLKNNTNKRIFNAQNIILKYIMDNTNDINKIRNLNLETLIFEGENYKNVFKLILKEIGNKKELDLHKLIRYNDKLAIVLSGLASLDKQITKDELKTALKVIKRNSINIKIKHIKEQIDEMDSIQDSQSRELLANELFKLKKDLLDLE